jgi:hypothetical protein
MRTALLAIILFLFCSAAIAAESKKLLQVRTIDISPYGIKSSKQLSGVYYEVSNLLLDRMGTSYKHDIYPYVRIIHELK